MKFIRCCLPQTLSFRKGKYSTQYWIPTSNWMSQVANTMWMKCFSQKIKACGVFLASSSGERLFTITTLRRLHILFGVVQAKIVIGRGIRNQPADPPPGRLLTGSTVGSGRPQRQSKALNVASEWLHSWIIIIRGVWKPAYPPCTRTSITSGYPILTDLALFLRDYMCMTYVSRRESDWYCYSCSHLPVLHFC